MEGIFSDNRLPIESKEKENGENVSIALKIIRHGDRTLDGHLTDYGREVTRRNAEKSGLCADDFDAVKAVGSTVGPVNAEGMGRAEETAHIYAHEIAGDEAFQTRKASILSYEALVTQPPCNHRALYDANLPKNFSELSPKEKAIAGAKAQAKVLDHMLAMNTPEAITYKKEMAGSLAYLITHYQEVAHRLKTDSRVLIPAGVHGPTIEFLFQEALIRFDESGEQIRGFQTVEEIGGMHDTSEAFTVEVGTDEQGNDKTISIVFDNSSRPKFERMELDREKVEELASFYGQLHPDLRGLQGA